MTPPRRGDVYLAACDPTIGAEIRKTRPALVLQNDIAKRHSPITIVAVITSSIDDERYPTEVLVRANEGGLGRDRTRLRSRLGRLRAETMGHIDRALVISLGLVKI